MHFQGVSMKGLILAGGKGTRLRPLTFSMAKQLVPIANKPVIEYGLESIIEVGVTDIGIIVGDTASEVKQALGDGSRWGAKFTYISQEEPLGLAHAVRTAHDFLGKDDFIMYLGDNLVKSPLSPILKDFTENRSAANILLSPVPNPSDFGVAEMNGDQVIRLEKNPKSNLALVGVYVFTRCVHGIIEGLQPSARGEYEITDAIQGLVDEGYPVRAHVVHGWWKDTGTVQSMLEANRIILEDLELQIEGIVDEESVVEGRVIIGKGAKILRSMLRGPIIIGPNTTIIGSYIGPFTAIDHDAYVEGTEVQHSILLAGCRMENIGMRLESCLIGRDVHIQKSTSLPRSLNFVVGDSSTITLP
jgi:glucose-1-phosphate thymidylyltransferase